MTPGLVVHNLSVGHGGKVLAQISDLDFSPGSFTFLTGPNGGGKTTFLKCLAGLQPPLTGTLRFRDRPLGPLDSWYLGPGALGLEDLTVQENLDLVGGLLAVPPPLWALRREQVIAYWDLSDHRHHLYRDLSTGFKKRCDLSLLLLAPRPCVFLDEPFNGLDAASFNRLVQILRVLKGVGTTLVLASHGEVDLKGLPDRYMTLGGGAWTVSPHPEDGNFPSDPFQSAPEGWSWLTL